jgi:hypothetical protein
MLRDKAWCFISFCMYAGIPYFNVLCTVATVGIGVVVQLGAKLCGCKPRGKSSSATESSLL